MNRIFFGNGLIKAGFAAFALALGLAACGDGGSTNGPSNDDDSSSSRVILSSSSSVIPGTDPESPSEVKPDGYYSNSSNCPAGLTCKYATITEYLNSTKTYGEILDARDGQVYKTITIGTQTWMVQNLNYAPDPEKVSSMGSYAWSGCYNDKADSCAKYGRLYTWEVAMDKAGCGYGTYCNNRYEGTQGVCPSGWHLPTKEEWQKLVKPMANSVYDHTTYWFYNGAGIELKTVDGWYPSSNKGTNAFGFSALPAGIRYYDGYFYNAGEYVCFWSSGEYSSYDANGLDLYYGESYAYLGDYSKYNALSVRCLKD